MDVRIHWLKFTIHKTSDYGEWFYYKHFRRLGKLVDQGHGTKGYSKLLKSPPGAVLGCMPQSGDKYFTISISGELCDLFTNMELKTIMSAILLQDEFNINRLDVAVDGVPFTPLDVENACLNGNVVSRIDLSKMRVDNSPLELAEDGRIGTKTVYLGSRSSERFLRVYDMRGPTRFEMQYRDDRAIEVVKNLCYRSVEDWLQVEISHVLDYISFQEPGGDHLIWWKKFIRGNSKANLSVASDRNLSMEKLEGYLFNMVSPALSAFYQIKGQKGLADLLAYGLEKRTKKWEALIEYVKSS